MKLYDFPPAVNAQRVRMFIAEKGLDVPMVEVDVRAGALHEEPFRSMNPFAVVPFLELDDGACIGESIAICRYLEELHPQDPLMGRDPKERAIVEMWNRRVELDGFMPALHALAQRRPRLRGPGPAGHAQRPGPAPRDRGAREGRPRDPLRPAGHPARRQPLHRGERFSVADVTGWFTVQVASRIGLPIPDTCPNAERWRREVADRPSTRV